MISLALITMLRLIPYLFSAANAWSKGYKWLTIAMVYVSLFALANYFSLVPTWLQGLLSSVFALLLLFHALDLKPKKREGDL